MNEYNMILSTKVIREAPMKRLFFIPCYVLTAACAFAQAPSQAAPSPAYTECTALASSNPESALAKADAWLKIDTSIAAQHCRAMALYGLQQIGRAHV